MPSERAARVRPSYISIPPIPRRPCRHGHALRLRSLGNHHLGREQQAPTDAAFCSASRVTFVGSRMPLRACRRTHRSPRCSRRHPWPAFTWFRMTAHPRRHSQRYFAGALRSSERGYGCRPSDPHWHPNLSSALRARISATPPPVPRLPRRPHGWRAGHPPRVPSLLHLKFRWLHRL